MIFCKCVYTCVWERKCTVCYVSRPHRASSLLPKAKLVAILQDPVKRAYSWYQHMKAHKDSTALGHTFSQVIRATPQSSSNKKLLSLRDHCLSPGRYHIHLSKWLKYYSYRQLYLIDGGELVAEPASVIAKLQDFLQLEKRMNYSKILRLVGVPHGSTCIRTTVNIQLNFTFIKIDLFFCAGTLCLN